MSQEQQANRIKSRKVELILQQLSNLPTLPSVATRLLQITVQSNTQADEVVQLIESDLSLASKIISLTTQASKHVNRQVVSSVSKAVVLLGFETVRNAVLSIKVFEALGNPGDDQVKGFDRTEFWKHCLAVACASKKIIPYLDRKIDPEEAFLCGLLHDLGKVALDSCLPKSIARVVQITETSLANISEIEQKILGIDHSTAGKRLAQKWGLPQTVVESIWLHHQHTSALPDSISSRSVIQAVHLADLLAREQRIGFSGNHVFNESSIIVAEELGCPKDMIETLARELRQEVADRAIILGLDDLEPDEMFQEALAGANCELGKLNNHLQRQNKKLQIRSKYFDLLSGLESRLQPQQSVVDVAGIVAQLWQDQTKSVHAAVYVVSENDRVIEGSAIVESQEAPLVFLVDQDNWTLDEGNASTTDQNLTQSVFDVQPVGNTHSWFFEQVTPMFDIGLTWWMPLSVGGRIVGGLLWQQADENPLYADQLKELEAFSACVAMALGQAQALGTQNNLCEELANINRLLTDTRQELVKKKSLATVGEMASGAAHEINNPLAIIVGRSQLLASSEDDAKRKKTLEAIADQGQEITEIIKELMLFAKPSQPQPRSVCLNKLIDRAIEGVSSLAQTAHIDLNVQLDENLSDIFVDEEQLAQAFKELLTNAINSYELDKGAVQIKGSLDDLANEISVEIIDQGCGMDNITLEKAFAPFFSSKSAGRSRGLGLSRCLRIIESNGGRLQLSSELGRGTTVRIGLPVSQLAVTDTVTA